MSAAAGGAYRRMPSDFRPELHRTGLALITLNWPLEYLRARLARLALDYLGFSFPALFHLQRT